MIILNRIYHKFLYLLSRFGYMTNAWKIAIEVSGFSHRSSLRVGKLYFMMVLMSIIRLLSILSIMYAFIVFEDELHTINIKMVPPRYYCCRLQVQLDRASSTCVVASNSWYDCCLSLYLHYRVWGWVDCRIGNCLEAINSQFCSCIYLFKLLI